MNAPCAGHRSPQRLAAGLDRGRCSRTCMMFRSNIDLPSVSRNACAAQVDGRVCSPDPHTHRTVLAACRRTWLQLIPRGPLLLAPHRSRSTPVGAPGDPWRILQRQAATEIRSGVQHRLIATGRSKGIAAMHVDLRRTIISLLYRPLLWLLDRQLRGRCPRGAAGRWPSPAHDTRGPTHGVVPAAPKLDPGACPGSERA
jgi:hypothetical protein